MIAQALAAEDRYVLRIVSRRPGPLIDEFQQIAPTQVEPLYRLRRRLRRSRAWARPARWLDIALAAVTILVSRPDLIYVNSTSAAVYATAGQLLRRHVLVHAHESGQVARQFLDPARIDATRATWVACSPSVHADLVAWTGLPAEQVAFVPSVPDDDRALRMATEPHDIPNDCYAIGACGSVELRKGADWWLEIARTVRSSSLDRDVRFRWVGDNTDPGLGHGEPGIEFTGPKANPYPDLARFDLFTLTSRDDPYPLVVIEAMLLGTPVVAFDVGGVREQIGDTGVIIPPGDLVGFAEAIVGLLKDSARRRELGQAARRRAMDEFSSAAFNSRVEALVAESVG